MMRWQGYRVVPRLSQNFGGAKNGHIDLLAAWAILGRTLGRSGDYPVDPKPFSPRCVSVRSSAQMALGMIIRSTIS
jgi:hypothetical protein